MKKRLLALLAAPIMALGVIVAVPGVASATSLSTLGAPPVNNTNCWERMGFGFTEVNCQWGTPYNYAHALYQSYINNGTVILYGSYWPTNAIQPSGSSAYHVNWGNSFMYVMTTSPAAFDYTSAVYNDNRLNYWNLNDPHRIMICGGRVNGCV